MGTNKCSYCNHIGHYINNCNDPSINRLHNRLRKDAIIHMYCKIKYRFNYLLHRLSRLTTQETRVLLYKNDYKLNISSKPTKIYLQLYNHYLNEVYSFKKKDTINIPYIENNELWDYAIDIHSNIKEKTIIDIYTDIIKISPRPYCYEIELEYKENLILKDNEKCSICLEQMERGNICIMNCKHDFCIRCVKLYLNSLYRNIINTNQYYPNCPLCRTYITLIYMDDKESYVYFDETFFKEFIPNYFNMITGDTEYIKHNYENLFYHAITQNEEESESEVDSPYNHPIRIHFHYSLFTRIGTKIGNLINIIFSNDTLRNHKIFHIINSWIFFLCMVQFISWYKEEVVEIVEYYENRYINN